MLQLMSHTGLKNDFLLKRLGKLQPELDYQSLIAELSGYSHPRRKIKELQTKSIIIRVKKGFYVFNPDYFGRNYSREIVANLLYGPSYISLEGALAYHKLIPERVENLTCVTSQKNKNFSTPIGNYSYSHIASKLYPLGITRAKSADDRSFLIAIPEKALLDYFHFNFSNSEKPQKKDIEDILINDLRIETQTMINILSIEKIIKLKSYYKNRNWCIRLLEYLEEIL
ncbi:MAG: hypothetical protein KDD45_08625 [Bdellovibrionales bacterium]|nr:hypothetical protein [Bdellovibrionales bacterium]